MTNDVSFLLVQRKEYFTGNANRQGFYGLVKEAKCPDHSWVYVAGYGRKGDEKLILRCFRINNPLESQHYRLLVKLFSGVGDDGGGKSSHLL